MLQENQQMFKTTQSKIRTYAVKAMKITVCKKLQSTHTYIPLQTSPVPTASCPFGQNTHGIYFNWFEKPAQAHKEEIPDAKSKFS